ncbi:hypothetical protein CEXT_701921 [Caerostris extrusa]|uniref:Uncharacterized protein n=1 Tax=Caerostris extrusa TaxID=172846 RepID=A0AAV4VK81_CAEEX|nr:hypothetical protein CEXT_701921 [Caerostris extrusa]
MYHLDVVILYSPSSANSVLSSYPFTFEFLNRFCLRNSRAAVLICLCGICVRFKPEISSLFHFSKIAEGSSEKLFQKILPTGLRSRATASSLSRGTPPASLRSSLTFTSLQLLNSPEGLDLSGDA